MFFMVRIFMRVIHFQVKYKEMVQELEHPTAGRIRVPGYQANCSRDSCFICYCQLCVQITVVKETADVTQQFTLSRLFCYPQATILLTKVVASVFFVYSVLFALSFHLPLQPVKPGPFVAVGTNHFRLVKLIVFLFFLCVVLKKTNPFTVSLVNELFQPASNLVKTVDLLDFFQQSTLTYFEPFRCKWLINVQQSFPQINRTFFFPEEHEKTQPRPNSSQPKTIGKVLY